jgi:hypothetical protein
MADNPYAQRTSGRPNAAVEPEMHPSSQGASRSRGLLMVVVFVAFSLTGLLVLLAL